MALTRGSRDKSLGHSEWRGSLCLRFQQDPHIFRVREGCLQASTCNHDGRSERLRQGET